jgi:hypothetical protein
VVLAVAAAHGGGGVLSTSLQVLDRRRRTASVHQSCSAFPMLGGARVVWEASWWAMLRAGSGPSGPESGIWGLSPSQRWFAPTLWWFARWLVEARLAVGCSAVGRPNLAIPCANTRAMGRTDVGVVRRRRPPSYALDPGQAGLGLGMLCRPDGPKF